MIKLLTHIIARIKGFLYTQRYVVGFVENFVPNKPESKIFSKIKWIDLQGYRKGWFADPFILSADINQIIVLAEEYVYATKLGRIVRLTIDRQSFKLLHLDVILELPTHLSFPIIFKENGKTYIYPENYQSGALKIYEYDDSTRTLSDPITLISEPLLDSQILKLNDAYYIFAINYNDWEKNGSKDLFIYKSENLIGEYKEFQRIEAHRNEKRGAGSIYLTTDNKIIRPTQNCEYDYGKEVILNELKFTNGLFSERELTRIPTDGNKSTGMGLHTYNHAENLLVVDGRGFRYIISRWIKTIISLFR